jgi:quercetin dioxygenase-like cupin family protein
MEQDDARLRRAPVERFAGPEHVYDLAELAERLRAEPHPATNGHRQITIAHHGSVALVLFDFEAGGRLLDHVADGLVTIHALAGRVQVRTAEGERELDAGTLLVLSPGVAHDLHASVPSQVLLTVHMEPTGRDRDPRVGAAPSGGHDDGKG